MKMINAIGRAAGFLTILALVLVACGRSNEGGNSSGTPASLAPAVSGSASTATESTPLDGTYETSFTQDELGASPLLVDPGEINDENWGKFMLTFSGGRVTVTQRNDRASSSTSGVFMVRGDAVTFTFDKGDSAGETVGFRWSLSGGTLTFRRDESVGPGPTPYLVKPWTKVH